MDIASGGIAGLVRRVDGVLFGWRRKGNGAAGDWDDWDFSRLTRYSPVRVCMDGALAGKRIVPIAGGQGQFCAVAADGAVFARGGAPAAGEPRSTR